MVDRQSLDEALARFLDGEPEPDDGRLLSEAMRTDGEFRRQVSGLLMLDDLLRQNADPDDTSFLDALRMRVDELGGGGGGPFLRRIQDAFEQRSVAPTRLGTWFNGTGFSTTGALVVLGFLLGPVIAIAISANQLGDYGLALWGWADSVDTLVQRTAGGVGSFLAICWLRGRQIGWLRLPWLCGVGGGASLVCATLVCQSILADYTDRETMRRERMIQDHVWISYDSAYYWPADQEEHTGHPPQEPTEAQIREELTLLRKAGFTGLFIHECRSGQIPVPRIARELGFGAIIQGIGVKKSRLDAQETQLQISNAISVAAEVDAYCLGDLTAHEVDFRSLKRELARIRRGTGKPATTSFLHHEFIGKRGDRLRALEDFAIRALAHGWQRAENPESEEKSVSDPDRRYGGSPTVAVQSVREALNTFRDDEKPSLLTFVFYPSGGGVGFTEEAQERFFSAVRRMRLPPGVNIVYFNSFDRPWMQKSNEVRPQAEQTLYEDHTGLFAVESAGSDSTLEFKAKSAVAVFESSDASN